MKPQLLFLFLLFFVLASWAQTQQYPTTEVDGRVCYVYPTGNLTEFTREFGLPDGEWAGFFSGRYAGELAFRGAVLHGRANGVCRQYYQSGQVKGIEVFAEGKREGTSLFFFENGAQAGEVNYANDLQHGSFAYNDEKGLPLRSGNYYNGKPHGEWLWWYNNSQQLRKKHEYSNGSPTGKWSEWYADGKIKSESYYVDSLLANRPDIPGPYPEGQWATWFTNGKPQSYLYYADFQLTKRETFFEEGTLATRMLYIEGAPVYSVAFWKNGDTMEITNYVPVTLPEGTASIAEEENTRGESTTTPTREKTSLKEGRAAAWHENGRLRFEGQYKSGMREGEWRYWDNRGKLVKKTEYFQDKVIRENVYKKS